jgi:hypothetical protein
VKWPKIILWAKEMAGHAACMREKTFINSFDRKTRKEAAIKGYA